MDKLKNVILKLKKLKKFEKYEKVLCDLKENDEFVIFFIKENGQIIGLTRACCLFYKCDEKDLLNKNISEIDQKIMREIKNNCSKTNLRFFSSQHIINNKKTEVRINVIPVSFENEKYYFVSINKLFKIKALEEKIRLSENRYMMLFNNMNNEAAVLEAINNGGDFIFKDINEAAEKFYNIKKDDILNKNIKEIVPNIKDSIFFDSLKRVYKTGEAEKLPVKRYKKNENEYWYDKFIYKLYSEELVVIHNDYTEEKRLKEKLALDEKKYREIFNNLNDLVFVYAINDNQAGNFIEVNETACEKLGYSRKELLSMSPRDIIEIDDTKKNIEILFKNKKHIFESVHISKDNIRIPVEVSAHIFDYEENKIGVSIARDISKRKKELDKAIMIQNRRLPIVFPLKDKIEFEKIYLPAKKLSGDYYQFFKIDENKVLGCLSDVNGKGVSAALSTAATGVLFYEFARIFENPKDILDNINKVIRNHLGEEFVAAICFLFDFKNKKLIVSSAGINSFHYTREDNYYYEKVHGSSLGMFKESNFEKKIFDIKKGDKFYFYSDGMQDIKYKINNFKNMNLKEQKEFILKHINHLDELKDDITMLFFEVM